MGAAASRGWRWSGSADPNVAERRLPENEEEEQRDGSQQKVRAKPAVGQEETQHKPDQRHQEGGNRPDVHELVLQMVAGEELAQPVLDSGAGRRRLRGGRGAGTTYGVSLGLAAEATEVGIRLDWPAALAAEYGPGFRRGVGRRQGGPIIGPAIGQIRLITIAVTIRAGLPLDG